MNNENLLLDARPSFVIIIPHIILMLFFIGFITIWKPLFAVISTHLRVTNKRVEGKKGIIRTESMDSPINQITSVKVTQGLLGKIFNYGTIDINTASGNYVFNYMANPEEIRRTITTTANAE